MLIDNVALRGLAVWDIEWLGELELDEESLIVGWTLFVVLPVKEAEFDVDVEAESDGRREDVDVTTSLIEIPGANDIEEVAVFDG